MEQPSSQQRRFNLKGFKFSLLSPLLSLTKRFPQLQRPWVRTLIGGSGFIVGFASFACYANYKQRQFYQCVLDIDGFCNKESKTLASHIGDKPSEKLYLIGEASYTELQQHEQIKEEINARGKVINDLRKKLNEFNWLVTLEKITVLERHTFSDQLDSFIGPFNNENFLASAPNLQDTVIQLQMDRSNDQLDSMALALKFTDRFNSAQSYLKRRFYGPGKHSIKKAVDILKDEATKKNGLTIGNLSQNRLFVFSYNIAAKIARGQEDYEQSDQYYEEAKRYDPNDKVILSSQIALWGDFAWRLDNPDPAKIKSIIEDQKRLEEIREKFKDYGLGLANLSWIFIQARWHGRKLALSEDKRKECSQTALTLANEAVQLLGKQSVNGLIFRGIARIQLNQELKLALQDFNDGLQYPNQQDHPYLLYYRAIVLNKLGDTTAYAAFKDAQIELRYRLNQGTLSQYKSTLEDTEKRLSAWNTNSNSSSFFSTSKPKSTTSDRVIDMLAKGQYQEAYNLLQSISANDATIDKWRDWIDRHFKVDENNQLIPKIREKILAQLGLFNHPTPQKLMALSVCTYAAKYGRQIIPPSEWEVIRRSNDADALPDAIKTGYLGVAYRNVSTGQIVIAHGGTDFSDINDITTDASLGLGYTYSQLEQAEKFTKIVLDEVARSDPNAFNNTIYHTGHSLGGAIAAFMASIYKPVGSHYAVGFDSPSSWRQLKTKYYGALGKPNYKDFPVTTYLTRPTFINCGGGPHIGRTLRLQLDIDKSTTVQELILQKLVVAAASAIKIILKRKVKELNLPAEQIPDIDKLMADVEKWRKRWSTNLACHDKDIIQAAFNDKINKLFLDPEKTYYVNIWPLDIKQWIEFEDLIDKLKVDPLELICTSKDKSPELLSMQKMFQLHPINFNNQEIIPLDTLEPELNKLLCNILRNPKKLDVKEKILKNSYWGQDVLSWLKLDEERQIILVSGPLNSWELMTYLRQQVLEASKQGDLPYGDILYQQLQTAPVKVYSVTEPYFFKFYRFRSTSNQEQTVSAVTDTAETVVNQATSKSSSKR